VEDRIQRDRPVEAGALYPDQYDGIFDGIY